MKLATLVAAAVGIWWLVQDNRRVSAHNSIERDVQLIVENMPGLAWFTDARGRILYLNPSTLEYVGATTEDIERARMNDADDVGWRSLVHPEDADQAIAQWHHSVRDRRALQNPSSEFDGLMPPTTGFALLR